MYNSGLITPESILLVVVRVQLFATVKGASGDLDILACGVIQISMVVHRVRHDLRAIEQVFYPDSS